MLTVPSYNRRPLAKQDHAVITHAHDNQNESMAVNGSSLHRNATLAWPTLHACYICHIAWALQWHHLLDSKISASAPSSASPAVGFAAQDTPSFRNHSCRVQDVASLYGGTITSGHSPDVMSMVWLETAEAVYTVCI
jgi:hypothetical protein